MQAVILAGGKGTRLEPFTTEIPKPLVPLAGKPIIEILLTCLKKHGVDEAFICVNHLAHLIAAVLDDGTRLGLKIKYSLEDTPLSTVAPLKLLDGLDDNFIVANGDILTDLDFARLYKHHTDSKAALTVATHRRLNQIDYGVLETDGEGHVTGFREKPVYDFTVSMGIYVFSRRVLDLVPDKKPFGFDGLMYMLLEKKEPISTYPYDGYWMDIGRPDDYEQAKEDLQNHPGLMES